MKVLIIKAATTAHTIESNQSRTALFFGNSVTLGSLYFDPCMLTIGKNINGTTAAHTTSHILNLPNDFAKSMNISIIVKKLRYGMANKRYHHHLVQLTILDRMYRL